VSHVRHAKRGRSRACLRMTSWLQMGNSAALSANGSSMVLSVMTMETFILSNGAPMVPTRQLPPVAPIIASMLSSIASAAATRPPGRLLYAPPSIPLRSDTLRPEFFMHQVLIWQWIMNPARTRKSTKIEGTARSM
jgi:hypothetical protein